MTTVGNRSELLFIYDIRDGNPNGDPMDENKPRIDEETGVNLVTDVRLKRTIRDYLHDFKGLEIFVREIVYDAENRYIQDGKMRAKDFGEDAERILREC
ncbi:type I CRISPR-associated protein Cas7, partial [Methanothrix sp.]